MARKRILRPQDAKLLRKCRHYNGRDWLARMLGVWYGAFTLEEVHAVTRRWTNQKLAAQRFTRDLVREYSQNAIYTIFQAA